MTQAKTVVPHPEDFKKKVTQRLARIEGQVRGLAKLVNNDTYCDDVLTQVASVQAALTGVARQLLQQHMHSCVKHRLNNGDETVIAELDDTLARLLKR